MLKNFTTKSAMIFPILGKGWLRAHIIGPHSPLILENEEMLMKLLLWADIHGWQKGTFQKESRICSSGVLQLPKLGGQVHTWPHPCLRAVCQGH